jgi:hypothetical protein
MMFKQQSPFFCHWLKNQLSAIDSRLQNTAINPALCKFILLLLLLRPLMLSIYHQHNGEDMRDQTILHAAISKASWTYGEEELKMICLFGRRKQKKKKKKKKRSGSWTDIVDEVRSILIAIFTCLTISKMDFSF